MYLSSPWRGALHMTSICISVIKRQIEFQFVLASVGINRVWSYVCRYLRRSFLAFIDIFSSHSGQAWFLSFSCSFPFLSHIVGSAQLYLSRHTSSKWRRVNMRRSTFALDAIPLMQLSAGRRAPGPCQVLSTKPSPRALWRQNNLLLFARRHQYGFSEK